RKLWYSVFVNRAGRFAGKQIGKLRDIVGENGEDLRALGEIVPADALYGVGLRVMRAVVIRGILDAPECGYPFVVKRNVVGAAHFAQRWLGEAHFLCAGERIENVGKCFARLVVAHHTDGEYFPGSRVMNENRGNFGELVLMLLDVFARAIQSLFFASE